MTKSITNEELIQFLMRAKSQTYAAGGGASSSAVTPLLTNSHQLDFRAGELLYRDIYFGQAFFAGLESVYYKDDVIWSMCYAGGWTDQLTAEDDTGQLGHVLQNALKEVPFEYPFRGPRAYAEAGYQYLNSPSGEVQRFSGVENISRDNIIVYELHYSGGKIA